MTVLFYPPAFSQGPSWDPQTIREKGGEGLRRLDGRLGFPGGLAPRLCCVASPTASLGFLIAW